MEMINRLDGMTAYGSGLWQEKLDKKHWI